MTKKLTTLVLFFLFTGCAVPEDELTTHVVWTVSRGGVCAEPFARDLHAVERGVAMWRSFGVDVEARTAATDDAQQVVVFCFVDGPLVYDGDHVNGHTSRQDDTYVIYIQREQVKLGSYGSLMAHELGHVLLPGAGDANHLPPGLGVMSTGDFGCRVSGVECPWTADDVDFIESFGYEFQGGAS